MRCYLPSSSSSCNAACRRHPSSSRRHSRLLPCRADLLHPLRFPHLSSLWLWPFPHSVVSSSPLSSYSRVICPPYVIHPPSTSPFLRWYSRCRRVAHLASCCSCYPIHRAVRRASPCHHVVCIASRGRCNSRRRIVRRVSRLAVGRVPRHRHIVYQSSRCFRHHRRRVLRRVSRRAVRWESCRRHRYSLRAVLRHRRANLGLPRSVSFRHDQIGCPV